jgi:hypothetical protein
VVGLRGRTEKVSESIEDLLGGSPAAMFAVLWNHIPVHMGGGLPSCIGARRDGAVESKELEDAGGVSSMSGGFFDTGIDRLFIIVKVGFHLGACSGAEIEADVCVEVLGTMRDY